MFDSVYVLAKGGVCLYSGLPQNLRQHLNDCNIECNENQIPIEILIKLSYKGITDKNVQQLTIKRSMLQLDTNHMIKTTNGLKSQFKTFRFSDFWYLLIRFLYRNYVSQLKSLIKTYILFGLSLMLIVTSLNEKIGKIDGCLDLNREIESCKDFFEEKTILFQNQLLINFTSAIFASIVVLLQTNSFIDDLNPFNVEHQNRE